MTYGFCAAARPAMTGTATMEKRMVTFGDDLRCFIDET